MRERLEVLKHPAREGSSSRSADLLEVTGALGAEMLVLAGAAKNVAAAGEMLHNSLARGAALEKFREMVAAQGGDWRRPLPVARQTRPILAPRAGIVTAIDRRRNVVYLPWFWSGIMWVIRSIPEWLFKRLSL